MRQRNQVDFSRPLVLLDILDVGSSSGQKITQEEENRTSPRTHIGKSSSK
jgi:hypothetical protein